MTATLTAEPLYAPRGLPPAPLIMQPKQGTLTRITGVVQRYARGAVRPFVWALCVCGTLMPVELQRWLDGSMRPQTCDICRRKRSRFTAVTSRAAITPFHQAGRRR